MKTKILVLAILVATTTLISGCGQADRAIAKVTGYSKVCVEGVQYLQFTSGATVQLDATGKPVTCR